MSKDMNLAQSAADESGAELPAGRAANDVFQKALAESGELDISAIAAYVHTLSKLEVKGQ